MTPEELSNLYIRIAFQYESALNQLVDKGLVDKDLVDKTRKTFYDSLDEEKLRTSQKVGNHTEIIRRYLRGYGIVDRAGKTILRGFSWVCHSKLDAEPQYFGVSTSMGKRNEWRI